MRSRFLTAAALVALTIPAFAQMSGTLSQTVNSLAIAPGVAISCQAQGGTPAVPIFSNQTSHWRSYNLATEGITASIDIVNVTFAVEAAVPATGATSQTVEIHLYLDPNPDPTMTVINNATLVALHTEFVTLANVTNVIMTVPLSATVTANPTDTIVVEVRNQTLGNGGFFFQGANSMGETAPTYVSSPACALNPPTTYAAAGITGPGTHAIIDLDWLVAGTGFTYPGSSEDIQLRSAVGQANAPTGGLGTDVKTAVAGDLLKLQYLSPNGTYDFFPPLLVAELFGTTAPPVGPPAPFNTVHFNPNSTMLTALVNGNNLTTLGFSTIVAPGGGNTHVYVIPVGLMGTSIVVQCLIVDPMAANNFFAITNGHEIQFL